MNWIFILLAVVVLFVVLLFVSPSFREGAGDFIEAICDSLGDTDFTSYD